MSDLPPPGHDGMPRPQDQEGAPESPKLGGEGDPITISDESGDGPPLSSDRVAAEGTMVPWVMRQATGLHAVEEEKKKKVVEEQRKKEEEEER